MNEVKKTTIGGRIRAAWRALCGKPKGDIKHSIELGVQIKRCNDCDRGNCAICAYKQHSDGVSKLPCCHDCGKFKTCEHKPDLGEWPRINCPLWEKEAAK